jgi:hypothetical protein
LDKREVESSTWLTFHIFGLRPAVSLTQLKRRVSPASGQMPDAGQDIAVDMSRRAREQLLLALIRDSRIGIELAL